MGSGGADESTATAVGGLRAVASSAYHIEGELARGGLGRVLLARDTHLGRPVALKEALHPDAATVARFVREARLTARLQHPNIVPIYEAGCWPDGEPFYAMRLISGRTLTEVVRATSTLDERLALVPALVAVADAIAYAHSQRIIHRDLKPDNVLLGAFGETMVIDWGIAKDLAAPEHEAFAAAIGTTISDDATGVGAVVGTPAYMSPEQARGQALDERSDVYSLGALVYHALAGVAPYGGASAASLLAQVDARAPVDIAARQPDVPPDLATIVRKAMARAAADRYPSARELADDLRRFQTGQLVSARRYSRSTLLLRWLRRHRGLVGLSAAFVAALAVLAAWSVGRIVDERNLAESRAAALTLSQARMLLDHDPTAAVAWLRSYPASGDDWGEVRRIAAAAVQQGVARHVLALPEPIVELAFSGDARRVTVTHAQGLRRWDSARGGAGETHAWRGVEAQAFVPGEDTTVHADAEGQLWRTRAGQSPQLVCTGLGAQARHLAVSADGRWAALTVATGLLVRVELDTGARQTIVAPTSAAGPLALAPDGSFVALAGADAAVYLWPADSASLQALQGHQGALAGLAFLDAARLVTAGSDGTLRLWSSATGAGELLVTHPRPFTGLRVAPDGERLVTADSSHELGLWSASGEPLRVLRGHTGHVLLLAFAPDGRRLASGGQDGTVRVWELATGEATVLRGQPVVERGLAFSADGRLLASGGGSQVRVWDVPPREERTLRGHQARVLHVAFSPDGRRLATDSDDLTVRVWDLETGAAQVLGGHEARVYGIEFSPDGRSVASAGFDGLVRVWSLADGAAAALRGHVGRVRKFAFAPDGASLVSAGNDTTVRLWDLSRGEGRVLGRHPRAVHGVAFAPDGARVASLDDDELRLWELPGGESRVLGDHGPEAWVVHYLPDGQALVTCGDGTVRRWDLATGAAQSFALPPETGSRCELAPDGRSLAIPRLDEVVLLELASGRTRTLAGHDAPVQRARFSVGGRHVIAGALDGSVRAWDLARGELQVLHRHAGVVFDVGSAPDGRRFASASVDGTAWVGELAPGRGVPALPAALRAYLRATTTATPSGRSGAQTP